VATVSDLHCEADGRRTELLEHRAAGGSTTGIDYIEVHADQVHLDVYFLGDEIPDGLAGQPERFTVLGGRRVRLRVTSVETSTEGRRHLAVELDQIGDFSDYVLEIAARPDLDERFRRCRFNVKVTCPTRFDCRPPRTESAAPPPTIDVDYLAKDYASFRQALLDLIPRLAPDWTERVAADLGITLLELLAYVADQLSYFQDAVANEAHLETARQRLSVRRHARLVDYRMHDGASARAFVHVAMREGRSQRIDPDDPLMVLARISAPIGAGPPGPVVAAADRTRAMALTSAVYLTTTGARLDHQLNEIALYDWGDAPCCLPAGSTSVELVENLTAVLRVGDYLLFEELLGPDTGDPTLADPAHRQVVRLTGVERLRDELRSLDLTQVRWDSADGLAFPLCVTGAGPGGTRIDGVSVARGNLLLADHGEPVGERPAETIAVTEYRADPVASGTRAPRFALDRGPLAFHLPRPEPGQAVADLRRAGPDEAEPQVVKVEVSGTSPSDDWSPFPTLIGRDRFDHVFAVEVDDDGLAHLRFGDDVFGARPPADARYRVEYRVGVGPQGDVGIDALAHLVDDGRGLADDVVRVRNPLPSWGSAEPESIERVRRMAPAAFRARQHRAVTEADYAEVTARHPRVRSARARFRWTGSWHTVFVSIDPEGRLDPDPALLADVRRHVEQFTLAGYDVEVVRPHYVPLDIGLEICAAGDHFRPPVEQAVRRALGTGLLSGGRRAFFHPDELTFGQPLYLSRLYAAVAAVDGVESVMATRFARLADNDPAGGPVTRANLDRGEVAVGPLEIVRLDDDPDFPENGLLRLDVRGGK
jgi:hypothetical protein